MTTIIHSKGFPLTEIYFKDLNGDVHIAIGIAAKRCKRAVKRSLRFSRRISHIGLRQLPT